MNWRLPTKEELNLMYENLHKNGLGNFAADSYWSSSENLTFCAWTQNYTNGRQFNGNKGSALRVRAVRDFEYDANLKIGNGGEIETGILFTKDGNRYIECAFEDLKIDEKVKFTWDKAMDYLKEKEKLTEVEMAGKECSFKMNNAEHRRQICQILALSGYFVRVKEVPFGARSDFYVIVLLDDDNR
jgi:hypothetical protein